MSELDRFEEMLYADQGRYQPPVMSWQPERRGSIDIVIDRQGRWFHDGTFMRRRRLIDLFCSILRFVDDAYWLVTPVEMLQISVQDVPYVVTGMECRGREEEQSLLFAAEHGEVIVLGADHTLEMRQRDADLVPYVEFRAGLWGRLNRNVYYELAQFAQDSESGAFTLWSEGCKFTLVDP